MIPINLYINDWYFLRPIHTWHAVPMPRPYRSLAMPCRAPALLRPCRVLHEVPVVAGNIRTARPTV